MANPLCAAGIGAACAAAGTATAPIWLCVAGAAAIGGFIYAVSRPSAKPGVTIEVDVEGWRQRLRRVAMLQFSEIQRQRTGRWAPGMARHMPSLKPFLRADTFVQVVGHAEILDRLLVEADRAYSLSTMDSAVAHAKGLVRVFGHSELDQAFLLFEQDTASVDKEFIIATYRAYLYLRYGDEAPPEHADLRLPSERIKPQPAAERSFKVVVPA